MTLNAGLPPKSSIVVPQALHSIASSQPPPIHTSNENQRRAGSTGQRRQIPSPRNGQHLKPRHKTRRPRLDDADTMAEATAIRAASSRRGQTSITHLMNFSLPPRRHLSSVEPLARHKQRQTQISWHGDKTRHIRANYRLVVDPCTRYDQTDVDARIDWDDVWQVLADAQYQATSCPICLSVPVASRMSRCGHIFCLACLMHYMYGEGDIHPIGQTKTRWRVCPICWDAISISETKPVRWLEHHIDSPRVGSDVVLRLMMRRPGSALALPKDAPDKLGEELPWCFAAEVFDHARVMKGTIDVLLAQFEDEIAEILKQESEDILIYGEDTIWTQRAIRAIEDSKQRAALGSSDRLYKESEDKRRPGHARRTEAHGKGPARKGNIRISQMPTSCVTKRSEPRIPVSVPSGLPTSRVQKTQLPALVGENEDSNDSISHPQRPSVQSTKNLFYFYQVLPHYFLSPLDVRILKTAFGDYARFPTTILPRVERISIGHVVDDDLRRRVRYLSHLPRGCEIAFLECDLTDIVSPAILNQFAQELYRRRKQNWETLAREEREKSQTEREEEEKRWDAISRTQSGISEDAETFEWHGRFPRIPGSKNLKNAQVIGSSAENLWHSRAEYTVDASASPSSSPSTNKTVWGTPAIAPPLSEDDAQKGEVPPQVEDDGWNQIWNDDCVQATFLEPGSNGLSENNDIAQHNKIAGRPLRKKKGKKITLMTTNARRAA